MKYVCHIHGMPPVSQK